ncbi:MAG: AIR carboxylase family protein, partial [Planctomycetota bacterium]
MSEAQSDVTVSIVMGSQSDEEVMAKAAQVMKEFGISHEMRVISAHRTP